MTTLHESVKDRLERMVKATGHVLAVADFDDILELDALAVEAVHEAADVDAMPVYIRGVRLEPLTIGKLDWLQSAEEWAAGNESLRVAAACLCLTTDTADLMRDVYDSETLRKAARRHYRRSPWTAADLRKALAIRFPDKPGREDRKQEGATIGGALAILCAEYGNTPDYWLYKCDLEIVEALLHQWSQDQERKAAAYHGKGTPPAASPLYVQARKFRQACDRLEAKWRSKA
jgi:hypothetical protein